MTGTTTPPPETSCPPCQLDPERWFDRQHHADALAGCLGCGARRWCAREALQCGASWGLWAGIWIDGRHEDAMSLLHAIAADGLAQRSPTRPAVFDERSDRVPTPLRRPTTSSRPRSVRTAVLARSAGHCEVLAEGCRYTHDRLVSRLSAEETETSTPPSLFAACSVCADMVAALEAKLAAHFGYIIDAHRDPAQVPFYRRRSRWVLLDRDGWLTEMSNDAQTA